MLHELYLLLLLFCLLTFVFSSPVFTLSQTLFRVLQNETCTVAICPECSVPVVVKTKDTNV
ncbi:hypothetical protein ABFS82_12G055600 [Erythranthe guttata]